MTEPPRPSELGDAIQEVTEKVQLLVREEIALAKAELTEKVSKLIRGIVAGTVAAVFAIFGLVYLLHAASWGVWEILGVPGNSPWLGYLIVTLILFLLGAIGGLVAFRSIKKAMPPTPAMAIEEAQLIRETVSGSRPQHPGTAVPEVRR
jgi:uncharacterized membrane protein YqjE